MNYFKLFERIGFRKRKPMIPGTTYNYASHGRGSYSLAYHDLKEQKGYESTHRYFISWEYVINDQLTIWVNTFKMTSCTVYLIDKKPDERFNMITTITIDRFDRTNSLFPNIWMAILIALPDRYKYISEQLIRETKIKKLL